VGSLIRQPLVICISFTGANSQLRLQKSVIERDLPQIRA